MNETYLDRATRHYESAAILYQAKRCEEPFLPMIGFHLQQAVEMAIRYQLLPLRPKTRDIDQLIRFAKTRGIPLTLTDYIRDHSEMFTMWETRRSLLNVYPDPVKAQKALEEVKHFLDILEIDESEKGDNSPKV